MIVGVYKLKVLQFLNFLLPILRPSSKFYKNCLIGHNNNNIVRVSQEEIQDLKKFIILLNSKIGSAVIVEGKRDSAALKKIGYSGIILEFYRFRGLRRFVDLVSEYESLIILLDGDRKGRYLTAKIIEQLERRKRIDLSFKKKLVSITKGKIRFIEELGCYESFLQ